VFHEEDHRYVITNADAEKVRARSSITGLVSRFHEHFDANEVVGKMRRSRNWRQKRLEYLQDNGEEMTDEQIREKWNFNGRVQSARGTLMHYHIEQYLNGCRIEQPHSPEFQQFLVFQDTVLKARCLKPVRTEASLFHCGLRVAGQCDLLCRDLAGRIVIVDWKRSKEIRRHNRYQRMLPPVEHLDDCNYWHYALQLNLYRYVLMSEYGEDVSGMLLGVFHPTQTEPLCVEIPPLDADVNAIVEHLRQLGEAGDPVPGPQAHFPGIPML
jgi:ATP-dependent exoDNAse (exonuclease V) beta subunit